VVNVEVKEGSNVNSVEELEMFLVQSVIKNIKMRNPLK
jgi:hypothetical protein